MLPTWRPAAFTPTWWSLWLGPVLTLVTWTCHLSDSGWWTEPRRVGGDSWAHPHDSGSELEPPARFRTESHPHFLGWPVAWYKREFLAMPVMGAGMTAMRVTPGLGTWVLDFPGAGGQIGRRAEGFSRSLAPTSHGPGSQARRAQGQEGLGVPRLCLHGDRQAVGRCPPSCSPKPHTLAGTSASTGHRGEFPGPPVPPWRGWAGHSYGRWSPQPPLPPGLVEGVLLEAITGVSPSAVLGGVLPVLPVHPPRRLVSAAPVVWMVLLR